MPLVVDASLVLSWCYPDERSDATEAALERARRTAVSVPPHFHLELANGLWAGLRSKRLDEELLDAFVDALAELDIRAAAVPEMTQLGALAKRAAERGLTAYDEAYLELAHQTRCALGTLDAELARAARALGVPVIGIEQ